MSVHDIPEYEGPTKKQILIAGGLLIASLAVVWFTAKAITRS